jgi:hypothetical protein
MARLRPVEMWAPSGCTLQKGRIVTHAQQMLQTNPSSATVDASTLVECIEACYDCAQSCTACADACLG